MTPRRAAALSVFAVDDQSIQVVWRNLRPGRLELSPSTGPRVVVEPGQDVTDPAAGSVLLGDLPPDTAITIRASGTSVVDPIHLAATTLERPPGEMLSRVATVSDLHLGTRSFGHRHTIVEHPEPEVPHPVRCARAALDEIERWGASTVVAKGDITNNGLLDQWRSFDDLTSALPARLLTVPGNHDRAFRRGSSGLSPENAATLFGLEMASPLLVVDHPGVRLVLVDSTTGRRNPGSLAHTVDDVVQAVSETDKGSLALVLMHHQLHQHPVHEGWPVGVSRGSTVGFLDRLASTGTPTLVSSGHTHRHRRWNHAGVTVTQVGSTKDYPGVWAGYTVHEGGVSQVVRRVADPGCMVWTDHTRRAALGLWRWISPGSLDARCFVDTW